VVGGLFGVGGSPRLTIIRIVEMFRACSNTGVFSFVKNGESMHRMMYLQLQQREGKPLQFAAHSDLQTSRLTSLRNLVGF
jgi:hypothetical protein